jgi:uncharacterized protein YciI
MDMRKFVFGLLLLASAVALAQRPWPPPGMQCPERTLVIYELVQDKMPLIEKFYDEHIANLTKLMKEGKIVTSGPTDDGRGVLIFNGTNWPEIEALLKKEPFTREGILKMSSHTTWRACEPAK